MWCGSLSFFFAFKDVHTVFLPCAHLCHPVPPCAPLHPHECSHKRGFGRLAGNELEEQDTLSEWLVTIRGKQVREGVWSSDIFLLILSLCLLHSWLPACIHSISRQTCLFLFFSSSHSITHPVLHNKSDRVERGEEVTSSNSAPPCFIQLNAEEHRNAWCMQGYTFSLKSSSYFL